MKRRSVVMMPLALFLASGSGAGVAIAEKPAEKQKAEQAVARFYQTFFKQQWAAAAEEMHPEARAVLHRMMLHSVQTTPNPTERRQALQQLGSVQTVAAYQKLDNRKVFVRLYEAMWKQMSPEFRSLWQKSRAKVLGSVPEGNLVHVVMRTESAMGEFGGKMVSVATVKRDGARWKLLTSGEFERIKQKLSR